MLWVGGGILLHGLDELHLAGPIPHEIHAFAERAGHAVGFFAGGVSWLVNALAGALCGAIIGGLIVVVVRQFTKRPEDLIVD